ncbi:hypothetical protein [Actinomarinicola tropica]|uniref:Uncharacterized protein n=1 Tax=Actinomarinicola tropica TaxID=2789776 RepID=A0A5Q2RE24_9ACTN|nr:hypothetical protein [Actinomarinicola tropica]QGG93914.1 hypothetical protein GH723_01630 [Actinomarinicola tropica]
MARLTFEGETHDEIVTQVRRWLASVDAGRAVPPEGERLSPEDAVTQGAEITKDALRIVAAAAPASVADSDLVKSLTAMGYQVTDVTRDAVIAGLDALDQATGGNLVKKVADTRNKAAYEMNAAIAKQLFRSVTGR